MSENNQEKRNYIDYLRQKYLCSGRSGKVAILNELCAHLECHRKHGIRIMSRRRIGRPRNLKPVGRKSRYQDAEFIQGLKKVWGATDRMCSKRMKSAIPDWLPFIEAEHGSFSPSVHERLLCISAPTIDRILRGYRQEKGLCATRPGNMLRNEIPVQGSIWDIKEPGFMEGDTVAHCGGTLLGDFTNSLTLTDIATTWTETRCVWGKAASVIIPHLRDIEESLPFTLKGFDSDCGSEFINQYLLTYLREGRELPVQFTRSRPYQKDDNAHVEQKNNSGARRYLGYDRFDFIEIAVMANKYMRDIVCPLQNHFHPSFKLHDKIQIKSRFKRVYEKPVTPYQRVMDSPFVDDYIKHMLRAEHLRLNPVALTKKVKLMRKQINDKLHELRHLRSINAYTPDPAAVQAALALGALDAPRSRSLTPPPTNFKYRSIIWNSSEGMPHF